MKSLTTFLQYLLADCGRWCRTSTDRDLKTITDRVKHEGLSFLTITLPAFGKDFERSLELGQVTRNLFQGFSWKGGLPVFLSGFLELVFDKQGMLLDEPSVAAIFSIRQITLAFGKIQLECTPKRVRAAMDNYVQCEKDIRHSDDLLESSFLEEFGRISRMLWADVFQSVDESIYYGNVIPQHGPGATAERLTSNGKWSQREWTQRLENVFPSLEYLYSGSWSDRLSDWEGVDILEPGRERPVRVICVPKTMKTPRIIAIEPACMMYMQQGILRLFEDALHTSRYGSLISWAFQEPNQLLAQQGSLFGDLATLDLSEASDRVSIRHVDAMLRNHPNLAAGVFATRSSKADVPGHGIIPLAKFASMGSALCFPFESMVFMTIVMLGIQSQLSRRLTHDDIQSFMGAVRVYGDDIIVPTDYVLSVIEHLELFGYKVNSSKSFWIGKFRESCGKEYYDGHDVSISRVRRMFPTKRKDVQEIISLVALRNLLYKAGLWQSAGYLDSQIERLIPFPYVQDTSPLLGRFSYVSFGQETREDPHLFRPLVRGVKVVSKPPRDSLDELGALRKCLTLLELREGGPLPGSFVDHLERSGRPRTVDIKTRWDSPC